MYTKLNKKARGLMMLTSLIECIFCVGILAGVWILASDFPGKTIIVIVSGLLSVVVCAAQPFVRYERYRYRFTDEEIDVKEGYIFTSRDIVPIERLHKISMNAGPFDRIFGLTKVIVTTAGGDVTIRFIETKEAEEIVEKLKNRINQYARESVGE